MKANITRGNSVTHFHEFIEDLIYAELRDAFYKELIKTIKADSERFYKEFMGPTEPAGIYNYPHIIGLQE